MLRFLLLSGLCAALLPIATAQDGAQVLVFSKTAGFRHASIPSGIAAVQALGTEHGFTVTSTESASAFTSSGLAAYDAVVFLNTTGDVLDAAQQAAFEEYIQQGGGFVGIHAAADTEYDWPWYGGLVGAYFESHPPGTPNGTVTAVDRAHPATSSLPLRWERTDEWYNYRTNPRGTVHVLATLDEQTYTGGTMGGDHPIAWCHAYEGGRSFYTGGGHTSASFSETFYLDHLWGGLAWAAGWVSGNCAATTERSWERTILDSNVSDPMELAVASDGRVFFVERGGAVKIWDPVQEQTVLAGRIPVTTSFEDGLLGITLDPDFETTNWAYLYYSPLGAEPIQRISRFTVVGNTLDLGSEAPSSLFGPTEMKAGTRADPSPSAPMASSTLLRGMTPIPSNRTAIPHLTTGLVGIRGTHSGPLEIRLTSVARCSAFALLQMAPWKSQTATCSPPMALLASPRSMRWVFAIRFASA